MVRGGVWLLVGGVASFLLSQAWVYVIGHNAFYYCASLRGPEGSLPHEGGPAGFEIQQLPVAGVECLWNPIDGGALLRTFHPDVTLNAFTYGALALAAAGLALVTLGIVRSRRRTR